MNKVHIAIIDDGVNEQYYNDLDIKYNLDVTDELTIEERRNYNPLEFSHGTVCAAIIRKYSKSAVLSSIKVIDKLGNKYKLIKAIEWCINNKIDVINLSIGTVNRGDKKDLKNIIDKANNKGIVIVSANKNEDIITYPAFFYNVIGVKCHEQNNLKEGQYEYNFGCEDQIDITGCGSYSLVNYKGIKKKIKNCNSFATPLITAKVANLLSESSKLSINDIKKKLWRQASNYSKDFIFNESYNNLEWIQNALIFSIQSKTNLEIDRFMFSVEKLIDIKNTNVDNLFGQIIEYLEMNKDTLNRIDTIIIDAKDMILSSSNSVIDRFLKNTYYYKKNILLLNDCINNEIIMKLLAKYSPISYHNFIDWFNRNKMLQTKQVEVPLILIINHREQNLSSLLLRLYECFIQEAYDIEIFTNDLHGIFYGFKYLLVNEDSNINMKLIHTLNYNGTLNNGDLVIFGVNISRNELDYKHFFLELEDIDIFILIDDNSISYMYSNDIDENEKIGVAKDDNNILMDFTNKNFVELLYKQIISILRTE